MNNLNNSKQKVDVAIIGAGSAGLPAFRSAKKYTDNIVLIEGGIYGTTCARVGCMPSKLLIAAAEAAHSVEAASGFGIHTTKKVVKGEEVMSRVRNERDRFVGFVLEDIENTDDKYHIRKNATFNIIPVKPIPPIVQKNKSLFSSLEHLIISPSILIISIQCI